MTSRYTDGSYLTARQSWHVEDSAWKARQIIKIMEAGDVRPATLVDIGCGAGAILDELSRHPYLSATSFTGYDISPQAMELAKPRESKSTRFVCGDALAPENTESFDVLLAIDVFEHVPDYMQFLTKCRVKAQFKIYHIPLDIHASSVLRNSFLNTRYTIGHLHYFTADSALATLRDTGHQVVNYLYTNAAMDLFRQHPSVRKAAANVPRWLFSKLSVPWTARVFGGYSMLALTR